MFHDSNHREKLPVLNVLNAGRPELIRACHWCDVASALIPEESLPFPLHGKCLKKDPVVLICSPLRFYYLILKQGILNQMFAMCEWPVVSRRATYLPKHLKGSSCISDLWLACCFPAFPFLVSYFSKSLICLLATCPDRGSCFEGLWTDRNGGRLM